MTVAPGVERTDIARRIGDLRGVAAREKAWAAS
jgi:hypothetical protein